VDLLATLESRCEALPKGAHSQGLRAVIQHIQSAAKHLMRGRSETDDAAFTDAIYRTNQAFEGALKEAYRVLAGRDPVKSRPVDIERFLEGKGVLRARVLEQLRIYRTDWRNTSTHNYTLDFDEDEALLAIASACVFAIVLVDQISEKLHFIAAQATTQAARPVDHVEWLSDILIPVLREFRFPAITIRDGPPREVDVLGAIAGYLQATFPSWTVTLGAPIDTFRGGEADIVVSYARRRVVIEVKVGRITDGRIESGILQVERLMSSGGIREGIVLAYGDLSEMHSRTDGQSLVGPGHGRIDVVGCFATWPSA
jgi:hypothetical protein